MNFTLNLLTNQKHLVCFFYFWHRKITLKEPAINRIQANFTLRLILAWQYIEEAVCRCLTKNVFLEISQISKETPVRELK